MVYGTASGVSGAGPNTRRLWNPGIRWKPSTSAIATNMTFPAMRNGRERCGAIA
jgi:hypothetical protein